MDNNKTRYYEVLGIEQTANREQIADAYRTLALKHHPMKCAREQEAQEYKIFVKLCEAYEVLSDPTMKRIYDRYGEYSLKNGVPKGQDKFAGYINRGDHFKTFLDFFGTSSPYVAGGRAEDAKLDSELAALDKQHRAEDIEVTLDCELSDFYNGSIKEINFARKNMLSETTGSVVNADRMQVTVLPGFNEETRLVYQHKGHESFGALPSDLVIKFKQTPLANFVRKGDDLIYTHTLSLIEAL